MASVRGVEPPRCCVVVSMIRDAECAARLAQGRPGETLAEPGLSP